MPLIFALGFLYSKPSSHIQRTCCTAEFLSRNCLFFQVGGASRVYLFKHTWHSSLLTLFYSGDPSTAVIYSMLSFGPSPSTEQNVFWFPLAFCYCLKHQIYLSLPSHYLCLFPLYILCHYQKGFFFIIPPVSSHPDAGCCSTILCLLFQDKQAQLPAFSLKIFCPSVNVFADLWWAFKVLDILVGSKLVSPGMNKWGNNFPESASPDITPCALCTTCNESRLCPPHTFWHPDSLL